MDQTTETKRELKVVVSDTGPLLHLAEADALSLLKYLGEIHIPTVVALEMAEHFPRLKKTLPAWLIINGLEQFHARRASEWQSAGLLDGGEASAIALAQQINADWLITDDNAARLFAQSIDMEVHGSLGVVLWVALKGNLTRSEAEYVLQRLHKSSLWISDNILAEAIATLDEIALRK